MGKNKKGRAGNGGGNSGENPNQNNNAKENNNGEGEDDTNSNNNGGSDIVMKMNLHCDACRNRIKKTILSFSGVKELKFEGEFKVKVIPWTKNSVDPAQLQTLLRNKLCPKTVQILSPIPQNNPKNPQNSDPNKQKEIAVATVVLKVHSDCNCNGCGDRIYNTIKSYQGVHEVSVDKDKDLVKVTGRMDSKKMVEMLREKLKKNVEIVADKKDKENQGNNNQGNNKGGGCCGGGKGGELGIGMAGTFGSGYTYFDHSGQVIDPFLPPQMFSDENPDGCSIM